MALRLEPDSTPRGARSHADEVAQGAGLALGPTQSAGPDAEEETPLPELCRPERGRRGKPCEHSP